jgi:putative transposase
MAKSRMDVTAFVGKLLKEDDSDVLKEGVQVLAQALMESEVSAQIGAWSYERSSARTAYRSGYRTRTWDTRVGTLELKIPKGQRWKLLAKPARASPAGREGAACGGGRGLRQGGVDPQGRRPGQGPGHRRRLQIRGQPHLQGARCGGRGVSIPSHRRRLSLRDPRCHLPPGQGARSGCVGGVRGRGRGHRRRRATGPGRGLPSEDEAFWTRFLRDLVKRGLKGGVRVVVSDAHEGLKAAIAKALSDSQWQRSSVHNASGREGPGEWAGGSRPSPTPSGEGLGSVTLEVQRQTCPSCRWWALHSPVGVVLRAPR